MHIVIIMLQSCILHAVWEVGLDLFIYKHNYQGKIMR